MISFHLFVLFLSVLIWSCSVAGVCREQAVVCVRDFAFECFVLAESMPLQVKEGRTRRVASLWCTCIWGGIDWFVLFMLRVALSSHVLPVCDE